MTSVVDKLPTIFDALQLENCNATRPVPAISTRLSASENLLQNAYGKRIFVDPNQGNDRSVGDLRRPLRTLQAALLESRRSLEPATIILRGGRYQLDSTVVLDYLDNGVAIMNFPHEEPILSGGRELNLDWTPWPCPALASIRADAGAQPNTSCWSASTQGSGVSAADFNQLFIQDRRAIRARHPNADPETSGLHTQPTGYLASRPGDWVPPDPTPPASEYAVPGLRPRSVHFADYVTGFGGPAAAFVPPRSFWAVKSPRGGGGTTFARFAGLDFDPALLPKDWAGAGGGSGEGAVVHAFHQALWGNWQFEVNSSSDPSAGRLRWTKGGYQEARGSNYPDAVGGQWYIENALGLLDSPGEWYHDASAARLYLMVNGTAPPGPVVAAGLERLVVVEGTMARPVSDVLLFGLTLSHTGSSFLGEYAAPNGGDYSLRPAAALVLQGVARAKVENCFFKSPGGNALLVHGYSRKTRIKHNEFWRTGDSAIVLLGRTQEEDATGGDFPIGTKVAFNLAHELGVWGKQAGFLYQVLSAETEVIGNIAFNGPRAGVCFTDGMGGGHRVEGNVLFNFVRETADHGPFNSWDRQPYLTALPSRPIPHVYPLPSVIEGNLLVANYNAMFPIDHDDGSCYYLDHGNVQVYGGFKNFLGDHTVARDNLYLFPDVKWQRQLSWTVSCCAGYFRGDHEAWVNNTCVRRFDATPPYLDFGCDPSDPLAAPRTGGNRFLSPGGGWRMECGGRNLSLADYQALGYDPGSSSGPLEHPAAVFAQARRLLHLPDRPAPRSAPP